MLYSCLVTSLQCAMCESKVISAELDENRMTYQ